MSFEPIRITAHLAQGYSAADRWSPAIDGILAYWKARELFGPEEFALHASGQGALSTIGLELASEEHGGLWWWQASAPVIREAEVFARHYHRRFDEHAAYGVLPETTRKVETAAGPYKAYRNQRLVRLVPELTWHVVGDIVEVQRLLERCAYIGHGIARGWGEVTRWEFAPGDENVARFHRPLPRAFAAEHGIDGMLMDWGIRPPGRAKAHQELCVMPV